MRHFLVRYICAEDCPLYDRLGWKVTWYGWRGDGIACFIASFACEKAAE